MSNALVLMAKGFEEMEFTIVVDVLRRAGIGVITAALEEVLVQGAHGIAIVADTTLEALGRDSAFDVIVLPGGQPGSTHLRDDARVHQLLIEQCDKGHLVAAICAAPMALEAAGILSGRRATSFPGVELPSATYLEHRVVVDDTIITSRGPGTAFEFALTLVERLADATVAANLRSTMLVA